MFTILNVTLPFFAVIACGYLAGMSGILGQASRAGLNSFVFYCALPVLLFSVMSKARFDQGFDWWFLLAWCLVSLTLFLLSLLAARTVFKLGGGEGAVHALGGVYGNTGYVGIPLVIVVFGPDAGVPVILCLIIDLALMIPVGTFFIEAAKGPSEGMKLTLVFQRTMRALVVNPLILAIAAGTLVAVTGTELPRVVNGFTDLLGAAAAPCALFSLGSSLHGQPIRGAMGEVGAITLLKLVVHPFLVWYVMFELFAVNALWGSAAVIAAAMPVAATVYVLAQQYETYVVRTSTAILISTVLSLLTITAILTFLPAQSVIMGIGTK